MEVPANPELRELNFIGAEDFAGAADRVVDRMVILKNVVRIRADFGREKLTVEGWLFGPCVARKPSPVRESEGLRLSGI